MDDLQREDGTDRQQLVERLALMEAMVMEGRRATGRYGWVFVLWGLVDVAGVIWQSAMPRSFGPWPITIAIGIVLQFAGLRLFCRNPAPTMKNRALTAIWQMMGIGLCLYCFSAMFAHAANGRAYAAAILILVGLAHGASAMILRWTAQGAISAVWLAGGVASYFIPGDWLVWLFLGEMIVGMVLFGLYAMLLESRRSRGVAHG